MSKQDSSSSHGTSNSIPLLPQAGQQAQGKARGRERNRDAQRKRFSVPSRNFQKCHQQQGMRAEEGGQWELGL